MGEGQGEGDKPRPNAPIAPRTPNTALGHRPGTSHSNISLEHSSRTSPLSLALSRQGRENLSENENRLRKENLFGVGCKKHPAPPSLSVECVSGGQHGKQESRSKGHAVQCTARQTFVQRLAGEEGTLRSSARFSLPGSESGAGKREGFFHVSTYRITVDAALVQGGKDAMPERRDFPQKLL